MDEAPARLRGKASWLINKTSLHAHRLRSEALAPVDAHGYHFAVLAALEEGEPASQADLSRRTGIDRSDMVEMVNELVDHGFVVRMPDQADRRRNVITMTATGRRRLAQLDDLLTQAQGELLAPLSAAERKQLLALLGRVLAYHAERSG
ncbi:MarR family winged helix-turn-helix transcriptional regulator [Nakamurella lactea]|uniref:MarR family winged helix-turn-helix transcriptional regulator n=1 Tax=Nakamurella lactea TaxID=459515 RepID=UPI00041E6314|nr:MarR family transcriptional regulator [Nakamurella lactea]